MNNGDLQLLPTRKKGFRLGSFLGENTSLSIALVVFVVLVVVWGVLQLMTNKTISSIERIDDQLADIHARRDKNQEEKLLNFERQVHATETLLSSHTVWVNGLREVQKLIEPRVTFLSLSADATKRTYVFHAVADSYSTVAKQIASFYRSDVMSDVTLDKVGLAGNGRVEFTMKLVFQPNHFLLKKASHE
ncbi:MAG: hypothetical protein AAB420_03075 [Patescibacteria group bacterium]